MRGFFAAGFVLFGGVDAFFGSSSFTLEVESFISIPSDSAEAASSVVKSRRRVRRVVVDSTPAKLRRVDTGIVKNMGRNAALPVGARDNQQGTRQEMRRRPLLLMNGIGSIVKCQCVGGASEGINEKTKLNNDHVLTLLLSSTSARLAQLVEHFIRNEKGKKS